MSGNEGQQIVEVWAANLEEAFTTLRDLVERYPYVAMVGSRWQGIRCPAVA
jgi:hypothetical protein